MRPLPARPTLSAPMDRALVVFVRPSSFARGIGFTIIDEKGRYMGDSLPKSAFTVSMEPGRHVFICWAENSSALEATVEAGKTYFVEVAPKMGALAARAHLLAVKPGSAGWKERDAWLAGATPLAADRKAGQAYLDSRRAATAERIRRGLSTLAEYDAAERSARVLAPADGI
jgi:hypothetical protein